ncbi:MAG: HAD hydrolase-like protein [Patescibacteria group bacterium]|nr:HAD hydrolase-like protein [Patescibacteria group bacterium]
MRKRFVLFDFDGVIMNSFQVAFEVNKMICPFLDENTYRKLFEGNINDWEDPTNGHAKECRRDIDFFTEYIPRMKKEVQIVSGIKEVITELEKDYILIIISSTITSPIQEFLKERGLAKHFTQILGNDVHKSKIEKIRMVFEKYNIGPNDCVFITDTLGDVREASQVGVKSIGVTWGFHKSETLLLGEPFRLVEKPSDLLMAVSDYFKSLN